MTKVSVIIPVYNTEKYLSKCLESCIDQTLKDIEIICINSKSTDKSQEILIQFAQKDSRIKVLNKQKLLAGEARNEGVTAASGEYIIFLDSDDWFEKDALEILYNKINKDNSDVILFNAYNYYEKTGTKSFYNFVSPYFYKTGKECFSPLEISDVIFDTNPLAFKMYNKNFWTENKIEYSKHKFTEDALPFFKVLVNAKKISIEQKPLYNYRHHKESSMANFSKHFKDMFDVYYICEKEILNSQNAEQYIDSFLKNRINHILFRYTHLDFSWKKSYYYEMRKLFKHILRKYGNDIVEKNTQFKRINGIIKYPYHVELLLHQITLFRVLINAYLV